MRALIFLLSQQSHRLCGAKVYLGGAIIFFAFAIASP
jgi:hypothetical protein